MNLSYMDKQSNWNVESLKEYIDLNLSQMKEISDLKVIHLRELREGDQKALDLVAKNNTLHFEQLNENAKRTIEERGHFITKEAHEPFKEQVLKKMDLGDGKSAGMSIGWAILIAVVGLGATMIGAVGTIIGIIAFFIR